MRSLLPCAVLSLALSLVGCGGSTDPLGSGDGDAGGPAGAWVLASADPPIDVPAGARITLTVTAEDGTTRVGGTAACNGYGGEVTTDGGVWSPRDGGYAITEMGCEGPLMQAEAAYMQALTQVDAWTLEDSGTLRLTGPDGSLTFDALAPVETASFVGTAWVVDGYLTGTGDDGAVSSGDTQLPPATLRFMDDGTFTMFSGCRDFAGEWIASGDEVQLTSWGQTSDSRGVADDGALTCGEAATAQENRVLEVLEGGFTAEVEGQRLLLRSGAAGLSLRPAE